MAWQTLLEKNGRHQYDPEFPASACPEHHQYPLCHCAGHGIQLSSLYGASDLQCAGENRHGMSSMQQGIWAPISVQTFLQHHRFPLRIPGIISGITMVFVPALTTFVISDLLGGSKILLIGNVIEQKFKQGSNWNVGSGLSSGPDGLYPDQSMAIMHKYDKDGRGGCILMKKVLGTDLSGVYFYPAVCADR